MIGKMIRVLFLIGFASIVDSIMMHTYRNVSKKNK